MAKMELQGLDLLSQPEQLKSQKDTRNDGFQTLDDRQHRTVNPEKEKTIELSPVTAHYHLERVCSQDWAPRRAEELS